MPSGGVSANAPRGIHRHRHHFRPEFLTDAVHLVFVFLAIKRAGAVHQITALTQSGPDVTDNLPLAGRAMINRLQRPVFNGFFLLAEHPFSRARHVGCHYIKETSQRCEVLWIGIGHYHVRVPPLRQVFKQNHGPLSYGLIGNEKCSVGQQGTPQRAFSSGRGTKIEHALGLEVHRLESLFYKHGRGLLHIIGSGMEKRIERKRRARREIIACFAPGHALILHVLRRTASLRSVDTHADGRFLKQCAAKTVGFFLPEQLGHLQFEFIWELGHTDYMVITPTKVQKWQ